MFYQGSRNIGLHGGGTHHGTFITWYHRKYCARGKKNKSENISDCDGTRSKEMPLTDQTDLHGHTYF